MGHRAGAVPARHRVEGGEVFRLREGEEAELYGVQVLPDAPRAAVVLIHGLGEHAGRYGHVMAAWRREGIATVAVDLRGFGRSAGRRGHAPSFDAFLDDVSAAIDHARGLARLEGCPLFLFGHSYGGLVCAHMGIRGLTESLEGVLLSSPALQLPTAPPRAKVLAARIFSRIAPGLTLDNGLDARDISRDPEVVAAYEADPLVHSKISCRMGEFTLAVQPEALARAGEFRSPLLLMVGSADRMVDPAGGKRFFDACGSSDKTLNVYDGFYHELVNEPEGDRVIRDMIEWIHDRS